MESTAAKEPEEPPKEAKDSELVRNLYFDVRALTSHHSRLPIKLSLLIYSAGA